MKRKGFTINVNTASNLNFNGRSLTVCFEKWSQCVTLSTIPVMVMAQNNGLSTRHLFFLPILTIAFTKLTSSHQCAVDAFKEITM